MPGTEGNWFGVLVTADHIQEIRLGSNNLTGTLPSELGDLPSLEILHLQSNTLSGAIPTEFGALIALEELQLNANQFTGSIPSQLGNLTALEILDLSSNTLTGSIPRVIGRADGPDQPPSVYQSVLRLHPSRTGEPHKPS
ncbi:MAG: hypothetical protein MZV49_12985 [Rhodopseudomonas palustris]|nr:hypothetical protein [Rhodopseudomonas palustris]